MEASVHAVPKIPREICLDGKLGDPLWKQIPRLSAFHFPWYEAGEKEETVARMAFTETMLYVSWECAARHISASVVVNDGPVSQDNCCEIFISPDPDKPENYYTFEVNCTGFMLNRCKCSWWNKDSIEWYPQGVLIATSVSRPVKKESPDDRVFSVELGIPWVNLKRGSRRVPPQPGDRWKANLMRTGGIINKQHSAWSPIAPDVKTFHSPQFFGTLIFSEEVSACESGRILL